VRHHPNVADRKCGVGFDAFDERRTAWGVGKPAFDQHNVRALVGDGVECAQRVGVLERTRLVHAAARLQGGQVFSGTDHDRFGHSLSVQPNCLAAQ
jgi:hypothetical protein